MAENDARPARALLYAVGLKPQREQAAGLLGS